ncbi:hypothetical protein EDE04_7477, partial [Streptomyces sp. 2132.2]
DISLQLVHHGKEKKHHVVGIVAFSFELLYTLQGTQQLVGDVKRSFLDDHKFCCQADFRRSRSPVRAVLGGFLTQSMNLLHPVLSFCFVFRADIRDGFDEVRVQPNAGQPHCHR